jgi:signal transduction histidine kinase
MQREPLDLRAMLEDCAKENAVALTIQNFPVPSTVIADATALRQVFSNLMRNSKEAERPGVAVAITAQAENKGNQTLIRISDNGSGIPQDKLSKIFIPFFTTKAEGTGLGLALVHRIVTDHGGAISVVSSAAGTTFTVALPRGAGNSANSAG